MSQKTETNQEKKRREKQRAIKTKSKRSECNKTLSQKSEKGQEKNLMKRQ
jgi:hypothetical protein